MHGVAVPEQRSHVGRRDLETVDVMRAAICVHSTNIGGVRRREHMQGAAVKQ